MVDTAIGVDMERVAVPNVPDLYAFVFAYVSGLDGVPWTNLELAKYADRRITRIWQGAGTFPGAGNFEEIDVESEAVSPQQAADAVAGNVAAGQQWTGIYGTDSTLAETAALIRAKGEDVWNGHVYCRLANWNLSQQQAAAIVGTEIHGMTCVAVQWASPSSNPHTSLPGTNLTLSQADVDLNVVDVTLVPGVGFGSQPAPPAPPTHPALQGFLVTENPFGGNPVTSTDGGQTWS